MAKPPLTARRKTGPLIVFIHVPKASGSTVNRHLAKWSRDGLDHAERYADQPGRISRMLPRLDWISGHLALNRMRDLLSSTDRELRFYGTIRQPLFHVAAQYNWQIEIFRRGTRFYNAHPEGIRRTSERIRASDNSDPQAIIDNILSHIGLFLNLQARFLLGDDIDLECAKPPGSERLKLYRKIALHDRLDEMLLDMTGVPPDPRPENVSARHFDRKVFLTEALDKFILSNNRFDYKLFWHLKAQNE